MPINLGAGTTQIDPLRSALPSATLACRVVYDSAGQPTDFVLTTLSGQAKDLFSKSSDELIGQSIQRLFPDKQAYFVLRQCILVADSGVSVQFELNVQSNANQPRQRFTVQIAPSEDGVSITYNDINTTQQKQLDQRQQQTKLLDRMLQTAPSAIALHQSLFDENGQITDFQLIKANQLAFDWLHIDPEEGYTRPLSVLIPSFKSTDVFRQYVYVAQTGEPARFEHNIGSRWYEFFVAQFDNSIIVTVNLTTERKRTELALKEQTETLARIFNAVPAGVFVSETVRDANGSIVDFVVTEANAVALMMTQRQHSATVGQLSSKIFPPNQYKTLLPNYESVIETQRPERFEYSFVVGGQRKWVDTQLSYLGHDRVISSFIDVTPIRQAEQISQQQSDLLRTVVDNVQVGIGLMEAIRDDQQKIVDFSWVMTNEANSRITLLPVEQMLGARMTELLPGTKESGFLAQCIEVAETGKAYQYELNYTFDGVHGWYDLRIVKQGDGILFSSLDITQRKLAELELERQNQFLQRANIDLMRSNDNLQQFAYVASHDLQEPLRKIQAFGDMLQDNYGRTLDPKAIDLIVRMQTAAKRMSLLIRDLLTYSRISTESEERSIVDLNKLMSEVVDNLYVAIEETGAELHFDSLPTLPGDRVQLIQLFQNLLSNAIKFGQPNIKPVVYVIYKTIFYSELPTAVRVKMPNPLNGTVAQVTIRDNGIGFDELYAERVFQVFQRLHKRTQYEGSGIGLAICRRVAENHGGTITAQSKPGQGATFTVYLPLEQ